MPELTVLTVSAINRYIALKLKSDENLDGILIRGEISNFTNHYKSGHWYFTLKDESSALKCIMFKWANQRVPFEPEDGMSVIASGSIQVYENGGVYQLYVTDIVPDGAGALSIAFEQLKSKLEAEGLFSEEHKRPINKMPEKICVISAETGAALQDVLNILSRRYPALCVVVIPTLVQGKDAPKQICKALLRANETDADTIILCRGGGSVEDLWAFNDEAVARQVYASKIPVISAIGHETDFTICDFTADLRAPTPSAAAELAVCDISEIKNLADIKYQIICQRLNEKIRQHNLVLDSLKTELKLKSPENKIKSGSQKLSELQTKLNYSINAKINESENRLRGQAELLSAFNPLALLGKGYSLTYKDNRIVKSSDEVKAGDTLKIRLYDSEISANVIERKKLNEI